MGVWRRALATPLSPTPPQVGYVSQLLPLLLLLRLMQLLLPGFCYLLAVLLDRIATLVRWLGTCHVFTAALAALLDSSSQDRPYGNMHQCKSKLYTITHPTSCTRAHSNLSGKATLALPVLSL